MTYEPGRAYNVAFRDGKNITVKAENVTGALAAAFKIHAAEFREAWIRGVDAVTPYQERTSPVCAVEQNEVYCTVPGCAGPYSCKARGLDVV